MSVQTIEQRLNELAKLRDRIDAEVRRLHAQMVRTPKPITRRSRHTMPDCGTESGYQRHYRLGEKCEPCKVAHAAHTAEAHRRRRLLKSAGVTS